VQTYDLVARGLRPVPGAPHGHKGIVLVVGRKAVAGVENQSIGGGANPGGWVCV
jgi:hypothetical protein